MNFIIVLIAIMALSDKRIQFVFRLVLSGVTAYWIFKFFYPNMALLDYKEYNKQQIEEWVSSGSAFKAILFTAISYGFFYFALRVLLFNTLNKPVEKWVQKNLNNQIAEKIIRKVSVGIIKGERKVIRKFAKWGLFGATKADKPISREDAINYSYTSFCTALHVVLCWFILGLNESYPIYLLAGIVLILFFLTVLFIPFLTVLFDPASKVVQHESDLIQKGITK